MITVEKTYSRNEMFQIFKSKSKQSLERKLARYGVSFTVNGYADRAVYTITALENAFKLFAILELGFDANTDFTKLHDYHTAHKSVATMCVREYEMQVPYGVVNLDDNTIKSITEKPRHKFHVSAGIYMLNPQILNFIPKNEYLDMPDLFNSLATKNQNPKAYLIKEEWLDIGRIEEYNLANELYSEIFS